MIRTRPFLCLVAGVALVLGLVGCSSETANTPKAVTTQPDRAKKETPKLSPDDQALADAQGYCVETGEPLGSMGTPIKLTIKGQPVFICCKGCQKDAEEHPDQTLAKVEELKKKVKTEKEKAGKGGS